MCWCGGFSEPEFEEAGWDPISGVAAGAHFDKRRRSRHQWNADALTQLMDGLRATDTVPPPESEKPAQHDRSHSIEVDSRSPERAVLRLDAGPRMLLETCNVEVGGEVSVGFHHGTELDSATVVASDAIDVPASCSDKTIEWIRVPERH